MARERVAPPPPQSMGRGGQPVDRDGEESQATPPERGRARKKVIVRRKGLKISKINRPRLRTKSDNSLSRSRNSEKKAIKINEQLKRNNIIMAKVVNRLKEALASRDQKIVSFKKEIMVLNEEISILRVELEKYENEDGGFVQNQKAVRMCLNSAIDSFSSFASVFNEEIEKAYGVLNHGLKAARLSRNSRSRSSGRVLTQYSRESAQFSKPPSPNKQLPQNKVSPMVAGHPITTRPRIQITRMTMPMTTNQADVNRETTEVERSETEELPRERPENVRLARPIRLTAPQRALVLPDNVETEEPQVNEDANESLIDDGGDNASLMENDDANASIMDDDVFDENQEQFVQSRSNRHQASPEPPRRTAFDMTVINEESYVASSPETPASTSRVHLSRSLRMNNSVATANQSTDIHHEDLVEENQDMMSESDNRNDNPNETMEGDQNTSVMDESLNCSFRRRVVTTSNRRSRPILSGFAFANSSSGSSVSNKTSSNPENIRSPQLRASPQVDVLKSRRHLAVRLNNVSTDATAMSKIANLEALSPLGMNSSRSVTVACRDNNSHTSLVGKSLVPAIDLNCSSLGDTTSIANRSSLADVTSIPVLADLDQTTDRLDISHAIKVNSSLNFGHNMTVGFNTTLTPTLVEQEIGSQTISPLPCDVTLVDNSVSNSPDSQEVSRSISPEKRIDTSSVSFLESLEYDPMEGPSWLFESLRKRKKRKSAGSSSGNRKRRKASRRSSPFILDSPNLSGTKSTTPESSPSIVDASKFLFGLKSSAAKSFSPGPENKSVNSDDEENISGFQQAPRRLSLDSSCLGPGGRTPLREITLEPQGEVFTYNPRVDSGQVVQGIREARINIRNTRTPEIQTNRKSTRQSEEIRTRSSLCKSDQRKEDQSLHFHNNTDNINGSTLIQNISVEVDNLLSSYNGETVQIRTPRVNVSNDDVRRSRASLDIAKIIEVEDDITNNSKKDTERNAKVVEQLSPKVPEVVENRRASRRKTTHADELQALQSYNQEESYRKESSKSVEMGAEIETDDIQTNEESRKKSTTSRLSKRASRKRHTSGKTKHQKDTIENDIAKDAENEMNSVAKVGLLVIEPDEKEEPFNKPLINDSVKPTTSNNNGKKTTRGKSADSRLNVEHDLELDQQSRTVRRVAGKSADSRLCGMNTFYHLEDVDSSKSTKEDMKESSNEDSRKSRKNDVRKSTREDLRKSTKRTSKIQNGGTKEDDIGVDDDDLVSIGSADSNLGGGERGSEDEMGEEEEELGGRRPSRRTTAKASYAEPSLRRKMRQGDPGTSSVNPGVVPQLKKKTKK